MRPNSTLSATDSESTMSSAFSDDNEDRDRGEQEDQEDYYYHDTRSISSSAAAASGSNNNKQFFAKLVRDTRSKVEQKTSEINATMQEKLPEWKQRGAMYSKQAKETSIEWSRRGKEAVDRWKKDRADDDAAAYPYRQQQSKEKDSENAVFGMPLEVAVALTKIDADDLIPAVFKRCIEYLNDVGVHEVGIYRIPGSTIAVNKLQAVFNDGSDIDFNVTRPDPHAVGTLLKMYLRELPEPIIPYELANEYAQQFKKSAQSSNNEGDKKAMEDAIDVTTSLSNTTDTNLPPIPPALLKIVRSITSKLPIYSFCILQLLCKHLKNVADNEEENRMSVSNLALIFIPTLNIGRALFHCMVEHYTEIFEGSKPIAAAQQVLNHRKSNSGSVPPPLPQKPRNLSIDHHHHQPQPQQPVQHSNPPPPPPPPAKKKIFHAKTMSDTDLIMNTSPINLSPTTTTNVPLTKCSKSSKIPPPKPSRSPLTQPLQQSNTNTPPPPPPSRQQKPAPQQQQQDYISGNSHPTLPSRPKVPMKPRSKSVSSPMYHRTANINLSSSSSSASASPAPNNNEENEDTLWRTRSGRVEAIGRQFETLMNNKK